MLLIAVVGLGIALVAAVRSALANFWTTAVPVPTGVSRIGTLSMRLVDPHRYDPYHAHGVKRELMVRFWYPGAISRECRLAEYASPKVWAHVSQISGFPLPRVRTNSCLEAPITAGAHPVIIFSHGYTGMFTDSTFLFEDLASRGYVVASVAHSYETTAVVFPDGKLIESVFGSYLKGDTMRLDDGSLRLARAVRLGDLQFVLDELQRLNSETSPFTGKLDTSRIGVMGHSLGGEVSISSLEHEPRIRAGVLLDAVISDESSVGSGKPVLILAAGREEWSEEECSLWSHLRGVRFAVNLNGAEHFSVSDAIWLSSALPGFSVGTGTMGAAKTIAAVRNYIAVFFDANLQGEPLDPLLTGPASEYPDAIVTTQKQSLCGAVK